MRPYLLLSLLVVFIAGLSNAAISVTSLNTTLLLNTNGSAQVTEIIQISISNQSVAQYSAERLSLNYTLSQWQNLVGPEVVEHIVSPKGTISNFKFLPGPVNNSQNGKVADLILDYLVTNVTSYNQTGPRTFLYTFNNNVFNFQHAESGQVLGQNTTLTVVLPSDAKIVTIYPPPDYPVFAFSQDYANATTVKWFAGEPLSKFVLTFTVEESLTQEVAGFFDTAYSSYGTAILAIVVIVVVLFLTYTYRKTAK